MATQERTGSDRCFAPSPRSDWCRSDRTEAAAIAAVAKEQITWPSWNDGYNKEGGFADRYHVHSCPSVFVLDGNGIIQAKDVRGTKLDEAVDKLLAEMAK